MMKTFRIIIIKVAFQEKRFSNFQRKDEINIFLSS